MSDRKRKNYSYKGRRIPATILYDEHIEAMSIVEAHWKKIMGRKYAFADVQRQLLLQEKERILKEEAAQKELFSA